MTLLLAFSSSFFISACKASYFNVSGYLESVVPEMQLLEIY